MNPLVDQVIHAAFPELASALRRRIEEVVRKWDSLVRQVIPQMDRLTLAEMRDSFPKILLAVAAALDSGEPDGIAVVVGEAPVHGLTRFYQHYGVIEVSQENRLLRAVIVLEVEDELRRSMTAVEAAALHATIDVMLLQAIMALVDEKEARLRDAAERELKYLSFLSHDMNNHLSGVMLHLKLLGAQLKKTGQDGQASMSIAAAEQAIRETISGMRQLLEHERLRKGGTSTTRAAVDLHAMLNVLATEFAPQVQLKGLRFALQAAPGAIAHTDSGLVSLVVRNLIGNAIKYAASGEVSVRVNRDLGPGVKRWVIAISDEGPGIAQQHLDRIFDAFQRGESHGQEGVGLGLAIASQAAKLLEAELTVESKVGHGSTFSLRLPQD